MQIPQELVEEMVAHALRDAPNECCGLVAVAAAEDGGVRRAAKVQATENVVASPLRFEIDGLQAYRTIEQFEQEGLQLGAIYHSHTRSKPYPSQTDINFARSWPGIEWVIIGVADRERPEVRSYLIDGAEVKEIAS
ncbi:MAG TPA: M67 family metallopeptidase [Solirubrobacteraceae bacterium]|jgi:proteasome lid subunit RPN8/RPN11